MSNNIKLCWKICFFEFRNELSTKTFDNFKTFFFKFRISKFSVERTSRVLYHVDAIYRVSKFYWEEKNLLEDFDKFFVNIVDSLKCQNFKKSIESNNEKQKKFIDVLLDRKNEFPDEEIVDHVKAIVYGV